MPVYQYDRLCNVWHRSSGRANRGRDSRVRFDEDVLATRGLKPATPEVRARRQQYAEALEPVVEKYYTGQGWRAMTQSDLYYEVIDAAKAATNLETPSSEMFKALTKLWKARHKQATNAYSNPRTNPRSREKMRQPRQKIRARALERYKLERSINWGISELLVCGHCGAVLMPDEPHESWPASNTMNCSPSPARQRQRR